MTYGMQILKEDGSLWLSPDFTPLNLINKGVISTSPGTVFSTDIPGEKEVIFFVSHNTDGLVRYIPEVRNGSHCLTVERSIGVSQATVYAFGNMAVRRGGYGIYMFNAVGDLIYSADMLPLEMHQVNIDISTNSIIDMGRPVAITPRFSGQTTGPNTQIGGFDIFNYYFCASGNKLINYRLQIAGGASGPGGFSYLNQTHFIYTDVYN